MWGREMNVFKIVCKEFAFLQNYGFARKEYFGDGIEVVFEKDNRRIVVSHYVGIDDNLSKKSCFDIIIEYENNRQNLLNCSLFDTNELSSLKNSLQGKSVVKQNGMLASFLKRYIENIL